MAEPSAPSSEFERGKEAGRVAQILTEHADHLMKINGSVADTAQALIALTSEVQALRDEATLRQERMEGQLLMLTTDIDRRREALSDVSSQPASTRRGLAMTVALALALALALVAVMFMALSLAD